VIELIPPFHLDYHELAPTIRLVSARNMPLPVVGEIHQLAALHCQRGYAAHLIAIRDAAVIFPP
jgi:hypothetical protein